MKRTIEFVGLHRAWKMGLSSLVGGVTAVLVVHFVFSNKQSAMAYASVLFGAVFQVLITIRNNESHLTADNEDVYLYDIPAALRYQKSLLGKPYIRVTSLTQTGYHRKRVFQSWISEEDWDFMLNKCT
ncbi:hypothetical protein HOP38_07370 [Vibrio mediterranei]|uniref:hypothetical protein n=1 Tax=Vibrio mediterranei TaxID=689 RepID=UPI001850384F|nr:hypothetical protein [Vibrio mediterranei]NUW72332.1 hypothetical protein [Vibrio mediterranei]